MEAASTSLVQVCHMNLALLIFRLCSAQSENTMLKSEHAQTMCQLTSQNEALRNSFRDQVRHLQDEHRKTVETLQHQLSKVETQLFQLKSEPPTKSMCICVEGLPLYVTTCVYHIKPSLTN